MTGLYVGAPADRPGAGQPGRPRPAGRPLPQRRRRARRCGRPAAGRRRRRVGRPGRRRVPRRRRRRAGQVRRRGGGVRRDRVGGARLRRRAARRAGQRPHAVDAVRAGRDGPRARWRAAGRRAPRVRPGRPTTARRAEALLADARQRVRTTPAPPRRATIECGLGRRAARAALVGAGRPLRRRDRPRGVGGDRGAGGVRLVGVAGADDASTRTAGRATSQALGTGCGLGVTAPGRARQGAGRLGHLEESPGRAIGHLVPDLLLALATAGGRRGDARRRPRPSQALDDVADVAHDLPAAGPARRVGGSG